MIDIHAHLNFKQFDKDREDVISRAFKNGVEKIINVGADLESSQQSVALAQKYENIYAAVGLHPQVFNEIGVVEQWEEIKKIAKNKKVVAIGEIGLDYFFRETRDVKIGTEKIEQMKKKQKDGFIKQLKIAQELNLPVIIHCREAYEDIYKILSDNATLIFGRSLLAKKGEEALKLVFHCYGGDIEFTRKLLKYDNIYFSFTGNITYPIKKSNEEMENDIRKVLKIIPIERIMIETDCPYLAPQEKRGERNEPVFVQYVSKKIAEIKGVDGEEIEAIMAKNAQKVFDFFSQGR